MTFQLFRNVLLLLVLFSASINAGPKKAPINPAKTIETFRRQAQLIKSVRFEQDTLLHMTRPSIKSGGRPKGTEPKLMQLDLNARKDIDELVFQLLPKQLEALEVFAKFRKRELLQRGGNFKRVVTKQSKNLKRAKLEKTTEEFWGNETLRSVTENSTGDTLRFRKDGTVKRFETKDGVRFSFRKDRTLRSFEYRPTKLDNSAWGGPTEVTRLTFRRDTKQRHIYHLEEHSIIDRKGTLSDVRLLKEKTAYRKADGSKQSTEVLSTDEAGTQVKDRVTYRKADSSRRRAVHAVNAGTVMDKRGRSRIAYQPTKTQYFRSDTNNTLKSRETLSKRGVFPIIERTTFRANGKKRHFDVGATKKAYRKDGTTLRSEIDSLGTKTVYDKDGSQHLYDLDTTRSQRIKNQTHLKDQTIVRYRNTGEVKSIMIKNESKVSYHPDGSVRKVVDRNRDNITGPAKQELIDQLEPIRQQWWKSK